MKITLESKFNKEDVLRYNGENVEVIEVTFDKEFMYLCEFDNYERKWIKEEMLGWD